MPAEFKNVAAAAMRSCVRLNRNGFLSGLSGGEALREKVRGKDMIAADQTFAALAAPGADQAFNDLLLAVQDNTEVHRTVLPYRAWDLLALIGMEHAYTLLRQSVHFCVVGPGANGSTRRRPTYPGSSCRSCSTSIIWLTSRWGLVRPRMPGSIA